MSQEVPQNPMSNSRTAPQSPSEASNRGLVVVFTGSGKGKTSAAMGVILRSLGHERKVYLAYFMKGKHPYGEQKILAQFPSVKIAAFGQSGFVDPRNVTEEEKNEAERAFQAARQATLSGDYDLVVLDEINVATSWNLLSIEKVLTLIREKPARVDLVLTGRGAEHRLVEAADMVTDMVEIKHPYSKGVLARRGIDY